MMFPSDSACQHRINFSQPASRSQSKVDCSPSLLPPQQHFEGIPPFVVPRISDENSIHESNNCNQSSNFGGFLQHVNFSIPPPFLPPALPGPVLGAYQIPSHSLNFNVPNSAPVAGILPNYCDPSENKWCHKDESVLAEKTLLYSRKTDERPQIQLHNFSDQLKTFHLCLGKLRNDIENLNLVGGQLDSESWSHRIASLSSQRDTLKKLKQTMNVDSTSLLLLKCKIKKRLKKRQIRRKRNSTETKSMSKYEIASSHMKQLQQIVDKQKQEVKFKVEADSVLFSVRQKKSEANSQIQFLTALSKLHTARINATNAQNKPSSYDTVYGFNKIIDKLKSMWQRQIEEYLTEENGLKIMLKDLVVTVEDQDCSKMKETSDQWLKFLFGTSNLQKDSYFSNYNELIEIRRDWDKYVVDEETKSSKIPAGWVVPRNDGWSKFVF